MIDYCGLYKDFQNEDDLIQTTRENYSAFLSKFKRGYAYRIFRKLTHMSDRATGDFFPVIEFIGVWDTVDAYGLPIDELATLWDCLIYPIRFPDRDLSTLVKRACHVLSVDDERLTFHPLLWNEANATGDNEKGEAEPEANTEKEKRPEIDQVWFPGVHSDVGGGYAESELAFLSLDWIMGKVKAGPKNPHGLHFIKGAHDEVKAQSNWHGKPHNSRSGLAALYRYKIRNIESLCNDPQGLVTIEKPKIHRSVFEQIRSGLNGYTPFGIPKEYTVIDTHDAAPVFESAKERTRRHTAMNAALDIIFWRRWLYFALLCATALLVASRFFLSHEKQGVCDGTACLFDPLLSAVQSFLPDVATGWIEALRQNSFWLWGFLILFCVLFMLKARMFTATQRRAGTAWSALIRDTTPPKYKPSLTFHIRSGAHFKLRTTIKWVLFGILFFLIAGLIITK